MITLPCLYAVLRPDCLEAMQRGTPDLQLLTCQLGKGNQQKLLKWHIQPEEVGSKFHPYLRTYGQLIVTGRGTFNFL